MLVDQIVNFDTVNDDQADPFLDLHAYSHTELIATAAATADFLDDDLADFSNLHVFTEKLMRIAYFPEQNPVDGESPLHGRITFSQDNQTAMYHSADEHTFDRSASRIVANLPPMETIGRNVFVAWSSADGGHLVLKNLAVDPTLERNYIDIQNDLGWNPGTYVASVYSSDESLQLLATGTYRISGY